ncbi:terminal quinol oxidase subunit (plasmid) [Haloferax mediterranei ATCC 33500]|uniref:Terminal quinol oxidase subunit n=1 Tax=Haloferax mediterranei (strain ATCC 33500 / DSM 1411 / JCM 8866 / NBRC 14739 / NCIMB 2177 / R-4) TaxID=523841 RepID=I3RBH9_HALMT|nr:terminal quinol oxidase subunit [Haloferax mediterranei ATCC 33500]ELZ97101.1 terminal quinol oxidase subunit [Haloferax mediterranei ATCC 33500]QCQ76771.1 terminal quinol oxidase subunit [Haloferax mediterranei ATCC 33500]
MLFAGGLAVLAIRSLMNLEGRVGYAEAKGVPEADKLVTAASELLLDGSLGIGFWKLPKLAAGQRRVVSTPT